MWTCCSFAPSLLHLYTHPFQILSALCWLLCLALLDRTCMEGKEHLNGWCETLGEPGACVIFCFLQGVFICHYQSVIIIVCSLSTVFANCSRQAVASLKACKLQPICSHRLNLFRKWLTLSVYLVTTNQEGTGPSGPEEGGEPAPEPPGWLHCCHAFRRSSLVK